MCTHAHDARAYASAVNRSFYEFVRKYLYKIGGMGGLGMYITGEKDGNFEDRFMYFNFNRDCDKWSILNHCTFRSVIFCVALQ